MSDTCIVCLGDLGEGGPDPALAAVITGLPRPLAGDASVTTTTTDHAVSPKGQDGVDDEPGKIAHLLPCGHNLHNDCLKAWVERANSCPICRQSFNVVEVADRLGGPAVTSYCVQDRVQVADVDPSMLVEDMDDEDSESQPCPVCGDDDNEDVLLLCDGCDVASHTYCVGLNSIPPGPWFCHQCEEQRPVTSEPAQPQQDQPSRRRGRRTRGEQRRNRSRNPSSALDRARVWQRVWDRLNLDLDFPFDDEQAAQRVLRRQRREASQRRDFWAWERRLEIARRQGGGRAFQDTAPAVLEMRRGWPARPRPRIESPEPESVDEIRAWNAFERAREIQDSSSSNRLKRKSPTGSPVEPEPQPERKLKRPRTRRPEALADRSDQAEHSRTGASRPRPESSVSGPSFLQSLLKEVEDSSGPSGTNNGAHRSPATLPTDMSSPRPSSPAQSPASSNRSSPRPSSATPPPYTTTGPTSPASVSSDHACSSPEFSPTCSPAQPPESSDRPRHSRETTRNQSTNHSPSSSPSRARSNETSPTRAGGLSLAIKSDLQKMVSTALKPHYHQKLVSKDEYTDINRRISRMLYDRVGPADALSPELRDKWQEVASDEVNKTVSHLREAKSCEASDSSGAATA